MDIGGFLPVIVGSHTVKISGVGGISLLFFPFAKSIRLAETGIVEYLDECPARPVAAKNFICGS